MAKHNNYMKIFYNKILIDKQRKLLAFSFKLKWCNYVKKKCKNFPLKSSEKK